MPSADRIAVLLDGEFLKKTLARRLRAFPGVRAFMSEVQRILSHPDLHGLELYRVFFYSAEPISGATTHPLTRATLDFAADPAFSRNKQFLILLDAQPDVEHRSVPS